MRNIRFRHLLYDPHTRAAFFLVGGTAYHFLYGSFRLIASIRSPMRSPDMAAFFYLSLAVSRLFLLRAYREGGEKDAACRFSGRVLFVTVGIMLLLLAETATLPQMLSPFYVLIVSGGYAVTSVGLTIAELLYLKRLKSPLLSASRAVGLASTLLSSALFISDVVDSVYLLGDGVKTAVRLIVGALALLILLFFAVGLSYKGKSDA